MNASPDNRGASILDANLHSWRPIFWEPVSGTGERLLAGVLYQFNDRVATSRFLRDDILDGLFGKQSSGASKLIDHALQVLQSAALAEGTIRFELLPFMGMHPGEIRTTAARSIAELLRTAALLHSSLTNLEKLDELEEEDSPLPEEINRRFGTEVRDLAVMMRPELIDYFGRTATLVEGGQQVKFGFCSTTAVAHFNVFHSGRPSNSLRDARARLFELHSARQLASLDSAILITAVNRDDDATIGDRRRLQLAETRAEIMQEAESAGVIFRPVHSALQGAETLIELTA